MIRSEIRKLDCAGPAKIDRAFLEEQSTGASEATLPHHFLSCPRGIVQQIAFKEVRDVQTHIGDPVLPRIDQKAEVTEHICTYLQEDCPISAKQIRFFVSEKFGKGPYRGWARRFALRYLNRMQYAITYSPDRA
jgi:hypothetical protein